MSDRPKSSKKVSIGGELEPIDKKKLSNASGDNNRPGTSSHRPSTKEKKTSINSNTSDENRPHTSGSRPSSKKKKKNGDNDDDGDFDDAWSDYSDDWSNDDHHHDRAEEARQAAGNILSRVGNAIHSAIFNFGPPYTEDTMDNSQLAFECQEYFASYRAVFRLLLKGANPNWKDEEDLFNTPTHFAAKHCHIHILRLLKEAHANFNIANEMGQTPLIYAVMMKQMNVKRNKQFALVKYLIRQGADVNWRDKGGYCPLDYAVMNDDVEMVKKLLQAGANVMRTNDILVAKRKEIISLIRDTPTDDRNLIARMINNKYEKEKDDHEQRKIVREVQLKKQLEEAHHEKMQRYLQEKREMTELISKQKEQDNILAAKAESLRRRILEEKEEFKKMLEGNRRKLGEYRKNKNTNLWEWHQEKIRKNEAIGEERIKESANQMDQYYIRDSVTKYQKQWKRITGADIEIDWHKSDQFVTLERSKLIEKGINYIYIY